MYLGTDFHRYWARCGKDNIHPDDLPILKSNSPFNHELLPCPFDGPLEKAKVIICLANPSDGYEQDIKRVNEFALSMRSGEEPLPSIFNEFYERIVGPLRIPIDDLGSLVAVFNVCPYTSKDMKPSIARKAAGLPSVWQAQKYLREVLIPRAQTGNIYLILIRKLQLWGVTQGAADHGGLRVIPNLAISGVMSNELGKEIRAWLVKKGHITNVNKCES